MRGSTAAAVLVTASLSLHGVVGHAAESGMNTHAQYVRLFDALWSTVNDHFYDPGFRGVNWKTVGMRYRRELSKVGNDRQFQALATDMLAKLGTSHLYIEPPSRSIASGVGVGVRFRTLDGEVLVSTLDPLSDARAEGLRPGDRLLSPLSSLYGKPGSTAMLQIQSCSEESRTLEVRREGAFWPPQHPGLEWRSVTLSPGREVGYIKIDRFDDGAAELADRAMAELKDTEALVIDVRANSGGNFSAARLASYFINGPPRVGVALFSREYLEKLGHPVTAEDVAAAPKVTGAYTDEAIFAALAAHHGGADFMTEDMGDKRYNKPVVLLIGAHTGSAAEGFAWLMHEFTRAKLVGRKTAGALLSAETFDLPDGWKVTVPVQGTWGADGTDYRDRPALPDVAVNWTRNDLCTGRDPDITEALRVLTSFDSANAVQ